MRRRLALLAMLAAVSACDAPPPASAPPPPAAKFQEAAPAPSKQQVRELSGRCAARSRDQFRRDWKNGVVAAADGQLHADFASHYNVKSNTCFYLLTVSRFANGGGQGGASADAVTIKLFDVSDGDLYGEYSGPPDGGGSRTAGLPATCRIESMYCASRREWEVLLGSFMED